MTSRKHILIIFDGLKGLKGMIRNYIFSGIIVTPLAMIFAIEKTLFEIIFGRKFFICEPSFKFCVALFKTFGMQKDDKIIFTWGGLEQGDLQTMQFPKV